jgi:hypothetical protein
MFSTQAYMNFLSNLKAGDEIAIAHGSRYCTYSFGTVKKVNGHGHIHLEDGKVFNKHGNQRTEWSPQGDRSVSLLQPADARQILADREEQKRVNAVFNQIRTELDGHGSYDGNYHRSAELKEKLLKILDTL